MARPVLKGGLYALKTNCYTLRPSAPSKKQQVWFIQLMGANVNLGNIASNEVVSLEALRLGLRGDTFFDYLPDELKNQKHKSDSFKS